MRTPCLFIKHMHSRRICYFKKCRVLHREINGISLQVGYGEQNTNDDIASIPEHKTICHTINIRAHSYLQLYKISIY
jgi:hypothetical protein